MREKKAELLLGRWMTYAILFLTVALVPPFSQAEEGLGVGVWVNYRFIPGDDASRDTWGQIRDEALIFYAIGSADEGEGRWLYSAEFRIGPGSFTDPDNNSTDGQYAFKRAWVGWQLDPQRVIKVGKSLVPFGWKTSNFWPGDIHLAGFGDQTDVGVKLTGEGERWRYDAAFYLADDWGGTSTDTPDDNRHWGSSDTFRKVQTGVGNLAYALIPAHFFGVSLQAGRLQDLTGLGNNEVDGNHHAAVIHYQGQFNRYYANASYIRTERKLPPLYRQQAQLPDRIKNERLVGELGYEKGLWEFYMAISSASPRTRGSAASRVIAFAPGMRYDYGPGWIYLEYLNQSGDLDRDGRVAEGNFDALYFTIDFYL